MKKVVFNLMLSLIMIIFVSCAKENGIYANKIQDNKPLTNSKNIENIYHSPNKLSYEPKLQLTSKDYNYNIEFLKDGAITVGDSKEVPQIYDQSNDGSSRYGYIVSDIIESSCIFQSAAFKVEGVENLKSGMIMIDARASSDKTNWSEFLSAFQINGEKKEENQVAFYSVPEAKFLEYRINILCSAIDKPVIKKISLKLQGAEK